MQAQRLRGLRVPKTFMPRLSVGEVLRLPAFSGSTVVAGHGGLERPVEQVNVMQVPTDRYVKPDELVLAAATAFAGVSADPAGLVAALAARGISALAVRGAALNVLVGEDALAVADRHPLPLVQLPEEAHLSELQAAVLEQIVTAQATELKLASAVRDRLADSVLPRGDLGTLAGAMAEIIEGDVVVTDGQGTVLGASPGADGEQGLAAAGTWLMQDPGEPAEVDAWVVWPIQAGRRRLGCIAAKFALGFAGVRLAALEHGATVAALQMLHRQEAAEADARVRAGFVRDLLSGSLDPQSAARRAQALGWSPDQEFRALLAAPAGQSVSRIADWLRTNAPDALVAEHSAACLALVPHEETDGQPSEWAEELARDLTARVDCLHVGISACHRGLDPFPRALWEAEESLRAAVVFDGTTGIRRFEDLGLLTLLVDVPRGALQQFRDEVLGPIDRLVPNYRRALHDTLEVLIECDLNVAETARRGRWHYNTVRSRVARLTERLGPFMEYGVVLDSVSLALLLERELGPLRSDDTDARREPETPTSRAADSARLHLAPGLLTQSLIGGLAPRDRRAVG